MIIRHFSNGLVLFFLSETNDAIVTACIANGPRQTNLVLITYASSEGSGEPESQIPGPSELLGMRS